MLAEDSLAAACGGHVAGADAHHCVVIESSPAPIAPRGSAAPYRPAIGALAGAALMVLATAAGCVAGLPVLALTGLVVAGASALGRWLPRDLGLLVTVAVLLVGLSGIGFVAGALRLDLLAHPALPAGCLILGTLALALYSVSAPRVAPTLPEVPRWLGLLPWVPAAVLLVVALADSTSIWRTTGWALLGTDLMAHTAALGGVQHDGFLTLDSIGGYPLGLQWVVAVAGSARIPTQAYALVAYNLRAMAGMTWACMALAAVGGTALAIRVSVRLGWSQQRASLAGLLAGGYLAFGLGPHSWLVLMGAAPTALFVGLIWVPGLMALQSSGPVRAMLVTVSAASLVITAAAVVLWPLVLPVPLAGMCAYWLHELLRAGELPAADGSARPSPTRRGRVLAVAATAILLAGLAAWLLVAPWLGHTLTDTLALRGPVGGPQRSQWMLGVAGLGFAALRLRRQSWMSLVVGTALCYALAAPAVALIAGGGQFDWSYYPMKVLRLAAYYLVPFYAIALAGIIASVAAPAWRWVRSLRASLQVLLAALVTFLLGAVALPWALAFPPASLVTMTVSNAEATAISRRHWDLGMRYAEAFAPAATIPLETATTALKDLHSDRIVSLVIGAVAGTPTVVGLDAAHRCATIQAFDGPVHVLTAADPQQVAEDLAAAGCPDLAVSRLSDGQ